MFERVVTALWYMVCGAFSFWLLAKAFVWLVYIARNPEPVEWVARQAGNLTIVLGVAFGVALLLWGLVKWLTAPGARDEDQRHQGYLP